MSSVANTFRLPGFAALPRRPAHICVTKDGTEVDSVPISDKALLFGRKVNAHHRPAAAAALAISCRPLLRSHEHVVTHIWYGNR